MTLKILQTTVLCALFSGMIYAQNGREIEATKVRDHFQIGISGAYTHNHLHTSVGYRPFTTYEDKGGFAVGVPVAYRFNDWFSLQAEPSILQKNYGQKRTEFYPFDEKPRFQFFNTYLQIPLLAHFSFGGEKLRGFCSAGGFSGFWIKSRIKGKSINFDESMHTFDEKHDFDKRRDNRLEYGLLIGLGMEYRYRDFCTFALEGRYYYSASDMQKDYMLQQIPRYNDTYVIQASILLDFNYLFSFLTKNSDQK